MEMHAHVTTVLQIGDSHLAISVVACCLSVMQFKAQVYVEVVVLLLLMLKLEGESKLLLTRDW